MAHFFKTLCLLVGVFSMLQIVAQQAPVPVYQFDSNAETRWGSFENKQAAKGRGAMENGGAKGHPFERLLPGTQKELLNIAGPGIINRIWLTVAERSPAVLRGLTLLMYWDGETKPAVAAPLADFMGTGLAQTTILENTFFSQPEGRSFVCTIPMPFKKRARVVLANEGTVSAGSLFYDVAVQLQKTWHPGNLYFHAYFSRDTATKLARDFVVLPPVAGAGRFLGAVFGVHTNPAYKATWWGEGEVKMYLDGDAAYPTLAGTGTEDYIGTGWGQGAFQQAYAGCTLANVEAGQWAFYRFHVPDPIYFKTRCAVTLQQIGGGPKPVVTELQKSGTPLIPVTLDAADNFHHLYHKDSVVQLQTAPLPDGWVNFYRSDDVAAVAYFYLDRPSSTLPTLPTLAVRLAKTERLQTKK